MQKKIIALILVMAFSLQKTSPMRSQRLQSGQHGSLLNRGPASQPSRVNQGFHSLSNREGQAYPSTPIPPSDQPSPDEGSPYQASPSDQTPEYYEPFYTLNQDPELIDPVTETHFAVVPGRVHAGERLRTAIDWGRNEPGTPPAEVRSIPLLDLENLNPADQEHVLPPAGPDRGFATQSQNHLLDTLDGPRN